MAILSLPRSRRRSRRSNFAHALFPDTLLGRRPALPAASTSGSAEALARAGRTAWSADSMQQGAGVFKERFVGRVLGRFAPGQRSATSASPAESVLGGRPRSVWRPPAARNAAGRAGPELGGDPPGEPGTGRDPRV